MNWLERQRIRYTLSHHPVPHEAWQTLMREADIFKGLSAVERAHLRELTSLFLQRKTLSGVQGLTLSTKMAITVAAQACVPILKLGLEYYAGVFEVVIYPGAFRVARDETDTAGLVSHQDLALAGESWLKGPVILAWDEVAADLAADHHGRNVVVHEFAHKLDMLNGSANGMPPLHPEMPRQQWTNVLSDAFGHLQKQLMHHHHRGIDPYAATDPAEFFAVVSEYFFADPITLREQSSAVYEQFVLFYRQDPARRRFEYASHGASADD